MPVRFMIIASGSVALGLSGVSLAAGQPATKPAAESAPASAALPPAMAAMPDFRQIVQSAKEKVFPSVVYIRVISEVTGQGRKESQASSGSGAVISAQGHVLTNWHVVDKATNVRCLLSDGRHYDAKVLGSDKDVDLAVIKLDLKEGDTVPVAEIGDSTTLKEGDFVMAMGAPWGLNRSVSIGIVSCMSRYLESISEYSLWIQTDAAINPGNSGGPLVNTAGQIVGINTRGSSGSSEGLGFSVPSETVKIIVPQLRDNGRVDWSWTGLQLQPLRDFNRDIFFEYSDGVMVAETDPDSPARKAGILAKDRILEINGKKVTALTQEDLPDVRRLLGLLTKGTEATLKVARDDKTVTIKLTPREKGKVEGDELALKRFDFAVKAINQFDNPSLYFHRKEGLFVFGVKYPGNAASAGLQQQDIILSIDGKEINSVDDIKAIHDTLITGAASKFRVLVKVLRNGQLRQMVLDFQRDYEKE